MLKVRGTVHASEFDLGFELHGDDGTVYLLDGGGADLLRPGGRFEVEGQVDEEAVGIAMRGPVLRVRRYRVI
jgi:hypothetical protein